MARYTGPSCKLCRREGVKLFLKGDKCFLKCTLDKRAYPPGPQGQAGGRRRKKLSDYGLRLREKQKLKRLVGILEAQMRHYYDVASRMEGKTGEGIIQMIERRLDSVVRHIGLATSPKFARQLVSHGHILVNGKSVNLPSVLLEPGDQVELDSSMRENYYIQLSKQSFERRGAAVPGWIVWDQEKWQAKVSRLPESSEFTLPVNQQYIVEFYTRR